MDDHGLRMELQRLVVTADPAAVSTMKRYAAAAALLIAGKRGRDMQAPEPRVQVGFEPDEEEMKLIVTAAEKNGRDLIRRAYLAVDAHRASAALVRGLATSRSSCRHTSRTVARDGLRRSAVDRSNSHSRRGTAHEPVRGCCRARSERVGRRGALAPTRLDRGMISEQSGEGETNPSGLLQEETCK